jgi:hypothetical protein
VIFRDATDITVNKHTLAFQTVVRCLGNNTVDVYNDEGTKVGTKRAFTLHDEQWVTRTDTHIPNPTLIDYENGDDRDHTKVIAYLSHIDEFKVIAGY